MVLATEIIWFPGNSLRLGNQYVQCWVPNCQHNPPALSCRQLAIGLWWARPAWKAMGGAAVSSPTLSDF